MAETDPGARVRQLLLSGDNTIKNRTGPQRYRRARERFEEARAVATAGGLPEGVVEIIDRRLADLARVEGDDETAR